MDLTFFYPTRTRKTIKKMERYCSGSERNYLRKHVLDEKEDWYHVIECIGRKKNTTSNQPVRDIFRHYIIAYYDYMSDDNVVPHLSGLCRRYDPTLNVNLVDKKYHVTTYQYK